MHQYSRYISQQINTNSSDNYYVPAKVDQMQKIIYSSSNINIFEKTIPMLVLYAEDNSYSTDNNYSTDNKATNNPIAADTLDLRDSNNARAAFIASEIFNRKYN